MTDRSKNSDEKGRVAWLTSHLGSGDSGRLPKDVSLVAGVAAADDCAVLQFDGPIDLVVGTDYVRGPKFRLHELGFLTDADVARFCVTANISDIAAMGAEPIGYTAVVRYPKELSDETFKEIMCAIDEACAHYGCSLVGGDTGSAERLILVGTALGATRRGRSLLRSTAEPGDVIAVTGVVGGAGAAVLAADAGFVDSLEPKVWRDLLACWTGYVAQPRVGIALSETGRRIACQDISDGLLATVRELGEQSELSAVLDPELIPLHAGVLAVSCLMNVDPVGLGISASTDFTLCFSCAHEDFAEISRALGQSGVVATRIGTFEPGAGVWFRDVSGKMEAPVGVEWRHQDGAISRVIRDGLGRRTK